MSKDGCAAIGPHGAVTARCARTSDAYAAAIAAQVAAGIPAFLDEATYLRDQLQQRLR
jgi:hypothetical protein